MNVCAELWIRDLETTNAPQSRGSLHNCDGFCCLGRAFVANKIEPDDFVAFTHKDHYYQNQNLYLSERMMDMLGVKQGIGCDFSIPMNIRPVIDGERYRCLSSINDSGKWTFKQIAYFLRKHADRFFI
ncbi:MAG: hypothetical protein JKY33_10780 [Bacteroidia bacterium]|nr:hypothetical protein [Bacteroidia bacterium]